MQILFITSTRLGDAVITTGVLNHYVHLYPDAEFTIACGPVATGLFEHMPQRRQIISMVKRPYDLHWLELWRACVGTRWDLIIDMRGSFISYTLSSRRRKIVRGGRTSGLRVNHLAQQLDIDPPPLPTVWIGDADRSRVDKLFRGGSMLIGLGPTANWDGKIWPAERFISLFKALRSSIPGATPVIFYGPGEKERQLAFRVIEALPGAIDAGGCFTLSEISAMLEKCHIFIGNDSGLMHLSAAVGVPTLGLFGPSRVSEYAPSGRKTCVVLARGEEGAARMEDIAVAEVEKAALSLLR